MSADLQDDRGGLNSTELNMKHTTFENSGVKVMHTLGEEVLAEKWASVTSGSRNPR